MYLKLMKVEPEEPIVPFSEDKNVAIKKRVWGINSSKKRSISLYTDNNDVIDSLKGRYGDSLSIKEFSNFSFITLNYKGNALEKIAEPAQELGNFLEIMSFSIEDFAPDYIKNTVPGYKKKIEYQGNIEEIQRRLDDKIKGDGDLVYKAIKVGMIIGTIGVMAYTSGLWGNKIKPGVESAYRSLFNKNELVVPAQNLTVPKSDTIDYSTIENKLK